MLCNWRTPELSCSGFPLFFLRSCVSKWSHMDADTAVLEGIKAPGCFYTLSTSGETEALSVVLGSENICSRTSFSSLALTSVPLRLTGRCEASPLVSSWLRNRRCLLHTFALLLSYSGIQLSNPPLCKVLSDILTTVVAQHKDPPTAKQCASLLRCHTHQHPPSAYKKSSLRGLYA